jgi:hypothetical protein
MERAVIATEGLTVFGIELELFRNGEGGTESQLREL